MSLKYEPSCSLSAANLSGHRPTLETTLGQTAPPKSGNPLRMPPDSGGIQRGCPLVGGAICPDVVSRVVADYS